MQRSRRANPYPFTWEIPVAMAVGVLFLMLMGIQAGRSVANAAAGSGWVFIDRTGLFSSLGGIFAGHADAGLVGVAHPASPGLMWTSVGAVSLVALIGCIVALRWGLGRWGPGRLRGMATRMEAEGLLGTTRLRRHARVIRPDLYGPGRDGAR